MTQLTPKPLSAAGFAPYGDVLEAEGDPDKLINDGLCGRFHDRALLDFGTGRAGISVFKAQARTLPYRFDLVERHPDGSQAFLPLSADPFLVIVAQDEGGTPGRPCAFLTAPGQGINLHRGVWHGVLSPLAPPGLFAVVDRIGAGSNLEEYRYGTPFEVAKI